MYSFDFNQLKKNLKKPKENFSKTKLALLGDTPTQLLSIALHGKAYEFEIDLDLFEADYDQIDLQVHSPDSELYASKPEFLILYKSSTKLLKSYYECPLEEKKGFAEKKLSEIKQYIDSINKSSSSKIILFNFEEIADMVFNNFGNKLEHSWIYQLRKLNFELMNLAIANSNVFVCDISSIQNRLGRNQTFDPQLYVRTEVVPNLDALPYVAQSVLDIVASNLGKFKKCLILDLDNTLWGGIIGDDGLEKIQLGDLGIGKAFSDVQRWALSLKERGIILAICSKNTEHIAKEPFIKHPDMLLGLDDISVFVANWENKADNIRYIQKVLNIGFDSMVFLDDSPFERNLVRQELPEVSVPELPEDPSAYLSHLQKYNLFETSSYSAFDQDRTVNYQHESKRVESQQHYSSIDAFLKDLGMLATTNSFDDFHTDRIAQLIQRSNQFNLRTKRYSKDEVNMIMNAEDHLTLYTCLEDKFGDSGLISVNILKEIDAQNIFIDTWIMSCRVLKRDVEKFVLNTMVRQCKERGYQTLIGEYLPTKKNELVKNHYEDLGFVEKDGKWYLDLIRFEEFPTHISLK